MRDELLQGKKMGMNSALNFKNHQRRGCKRNCYVYPPKTTFDQSNSRGRLEECLCDPLDGNNSVVEHLHKFACKNVQTTIG